jgi:hypothetical protein
MKIRILFFSAICLCLAVFPLAAQTNQPVIFPGEDPQSLKLVWPATPGLRYEVQQSTNLQSWTTAPVIPRPRLARPSRCLSRPPATLASSR